MRNGKLVYINEAIQKKYEHFLQNLKEGQIVFEFLETPSSDGTNLQLAKIHVFIRKIANQTGASFTDIKNEVKKRSGLNYTDLTKSFGDCSSEELGLVLETIRELCGVLEIPYE
jgi:hypothetical protein